MTGDQLKDLIALARHVEWRYKLDQFEKAAIGDILTAVNQARREIGQYLDARGRESGTWSERRALELLDELRDLTVGLRAQETRFIADIATIVTQESLPLHADILSFGGRVKGFNTVSLSAEQLRSLVTETPVGGRLLRQWVEDSFETRVQTDIRREVLTGSLRGEGYRKLVRRIEDGFGLVRDDAVTLARTYVQSANVGAMEAVYEANRDIVNGVRWCAALEDGYIDTGRGTCLRCAALDGQEWGMDDQRPECPLHPRCRCVLLPKTRTWRELGLDMDEVAEVYRPYAMHGNTNIGAGGRRTIEEVGRHQGDYASWFGKQSHTFKENVVGPGRLDLLRRGEVGFKDLVDPQTGRLRTIEELGGRHHHRVTRPTSPTNGAARVRETLAREEAKIATRKTEKMVVVDEGGRVIFERVGGRNSVRFLVTEAKAFRGAYLTHNHPGGSSFSPADMKTAIRYGVRELRAVTAEHLHRVRFAVESGREAWAEREIMLLKDRFEPKVVKEILARLESGTLNRREANIMMWHRIWSHIAKELPWMSYTRTRRRG
ncbi:hypothetical protein GGQ74_001147 [Desulfobaculum xiamenense]|uniref:Phage head morphogenesis domain-containing protein n=1 Tax=Desulfobaculum xiamenense TaxID=995050 RepID=A0A846QK52_9BACT|nr:phage minor head protein [Desulfobaculum xiamenense]NJB67507.1 hypothetical protein [Desulfobaculum xiamenense]